MIAICRNENLSLSNVTLSSDYVVLLIRAVPTVVSDPAPDIEKRRNVCPLGGAGAVRGGGRSASGSLARRGLQHIGACQSTALYAADAVREARGASKRRADGAGRARAAHAHHVALHCHAERPIRGGGAESMRDVSPLSILVGSSGKLDQNTRTDAADVLVQCNKHRLHAPQRS